MINQSKEEEELKSQCRYFVVRKKRLCRMTVKPGNYYCGEHIPHSNTQVQNDTRVPCPNDPKHTCFASKLEKHLKKCNARQQDLPDYFERNVNSPAETCVPRQLLKDVPLDKLKEIIDKVNLLYEKYLEGNIKELPERDIHLALKEEWMTEGRTETSLRHLRQVSQLMWLVEDERLAYNNTCYVELGAGRGHLSYFAWQAWCTGPLNRSCVLLVERAALRYKRDNKIHSKLSNKDNLKDDSSLNDDGSNGTGEDSATRDNVLEGREEGAVRVRVDIAHLLLHKVPAVQNKNVVGLTKHLCGVATDYALRCLCAPDSVGLLRGVVMSTCCHHRCQPAGYVGTPYLKRLGIDESELRIMFGVVSWATCGDGRARSHPHTDRNPEHLRREIVGRRAKALVDWGRVLYLEDRGFDARLVHYVPTAVSLENVCIVATKSLNKTM